MCIHLGPSGATLSWSILVNRNSRPADFVSTSPSTNHRTRQRRFDSIDSNTVLVLVRRLPQPPTTDCHARRQIESGWLRGSSSRQAGQDRTGQASYPQKQTFPPTSKPPIVVIIKACLLKAGRAPSDDGWAGCNLPLGGAYTCC
jgi:hypothetical protein